MTAACWLIAAFGSEVDWTLYLGSVLLLLLAVALVLVRRQRVAGRELSDLPWALAYLAATGLLRAGMPGEAALALIPVVCIALTGSSWVELAVVIVATAAACIVPAVVDTPVKFASLRPPLVTIVLAIGIGIATRLLVAAVRRQAETAERDRLAVERVGEVVYGLFASPDVRADLCAASLQVGYAQIAVLLEPMSDGEVRVSARSPA